MKDELLIGLLFLMIIIISGVSIIGNMKAREWTHTLERENARMEQQIIDYRWQLEQLQYTCNTFVGE